VRCLTSGRTMPPRYLSTEHVCKWNSFAVERCDRNPILLRYVKQSGRTRLREISFGEVWGGGPMLRLMVSNLWIPERDTKKYA
jgi:hypothetical protein